MTVFCWSQAKAYVQRLPDSPEPFDWKEYVGDAFAAGYEAAMKDGMQEITEQLKNLIRAQYLIIDAPKEEK